MINEGKRRLELSDFQVAYTAATDANAMLRFSVSELIFPVDSTDLKDAEIVTIHGCLLRRTSEGQLVATGPSRKIGRGYYPQVAWNDNFENLIIDSIKANMPSLLDLLVPKEPNVDYNKNKIPGTITLER